MHTQLLLVRFGTLIEASKVSYFITQRCGKCMGKWDVVTRVLWTTPFYNVMQMTFVRKGSGEGCRCSFVVKGETINQ